MKAWRWHCTTHDLDLLTLQTGDHPPMFCSGFAEIVYPDDGPCWFQGTPILYMIPDRAHSLKSTGQVRRVGQSAGTPIPSSAPRHSST